MNTDKHGFKSRSLRLRGRCAIALVVVSLLSLCAGCASNHDAHNAIQKVPDPPPTNPPAPPKQGKGQASILKRAAIIPSAPFEEGWRPLFDGKTLAGWKETLFAGPGETECVSNLIVLNEGDPFTGISFTNAFPKTDYEIALDAMRVSGSDFFCGLTFPVGDSFCSLIVGGWGGSLVGLSSIDGMDASENETTKFLNFETGKWYRIRLRVTKDRIEGWLDKEKLVDVNTKGHRISLRAGEIEMSVPLGICAWQTTGAIREMRMRSVSRPADPPKRF